MEMWFNWNSRQFKEKKETRWIFVGILRKKKKIKKPSENNHSSKKKINTWTTFGVIPVAMQPHRQMGNWWPHPLSRCPCSRWRERQTAAVLKKKGLPAIHLQQYLCKDKRLIPHSFPLPGLDEASVRSTETLHTVCPFAFVDSAWAGGFTEQRLDETRLWSRFLSLRACTAKSLYCGCWEEKKKGRLYCAMLCGSYAESSRPARMIWVCFLNYVS